MFKFPLFVVINMIILASWWYFGSDRLQTVTVSPAIETQSPITPEEEISSLNAHTLTLNDIMPVGNHTIPDTTPYMARQNPLVDTSYPSWFYTSSDPITFGDMLERLPTQDDANTWIYIPQFGALMPVRDVSEADYQMLLSGREIDSDAYLADGVLHHATTRAPWEGIGNYVVAGHTSYWKGQPGHYKTVFQFLPFLRSDDTIWLIRQVGETLGGKYEFYKFRVQASFETAATDISIFEIEPDRNKITLYGCYPFGTAAKRWVVQGIVR